MTSVQSQSAHALTCTSLLPQMKCITHSTCAHIYYLVSLNIHQASFIISRYIDESSEGTLHHMHFHVTGYLSECCSDAICNKAKKFYGLLVGRFSLFFHNKIKFITFGAELFHEKTYKISQKVYFYKNKQYTIMYNIINL